MAQQTTISWLQDKLNNVKPTQFCSIETIKEWVEQAKAMEKEQRIKDYNAGYTDAQCNHINDADNYANEIEYLRSRIDEIDDEIKRREDKIADLLINGETYKKD